MQRYGCFETQTACGRCGQPAPINGPLRCVDCAACHTPVQIPPDVLSGIMNDFEEDHPAFEKGEGRSGTIMSGAGTFTYGCYSLDPRCSSCGAAFPEFDADADMTTSCVSCGTPMEVYPAPKWLSDIVPSAVQCVSVERERDGDARPGVQPDEESKNPVVMSCPQCGGALTVTGGSERILKCVYCSVDVYIPDAVWARLHPVKKTAEWFIRFEGKTPSQRAAEIRARDVKEEKAALAGWKPKRKAARGTPWIKYMLLGMALIVFLLVGVSVMMGLLGYEKEEIEGVRTVIMTAIGITVFVVVTAGGALHMNIAYWFATPGKCKKAMSALAEKHGWKHEGAEYKMNMGSIDATYRGRDIEIDPDGDYAIEVDIDGSPFYLKTEPPGYPPDGLVRFTTGNVLFDDTFPIRYAKPEIVKGIKQSPESLDRLISPFIWFMNRWSERLAMLRVDWSSIAVHLSPGHEERTLISTKYLKPGDIEPLLEDMMVVAKAIELIVRGRDPVLPE